MNLEVADIETLKNCFVYVGINLITNKKSVFVIHSERNDFPQLKVHILSLDGLIGFNIVGFDYAVLHPFLIGEEEATAEKIYKRAQKLIEAEKREWIKPLIPLRDLFLIWHFNNKARSTSLKWLQFNTNWHNVQEMPIPHTTKVTSDQIPTIIDYCTNDVETTLAFYKRSAPKIRLRKTLTEKYGTDMGNYSDNKIGEEIFLTGISNKTGTDKKVLRKGRTPRPSMNVDEILLPSIEFISSEFNDIHQQYKKMVITDTKKENKLNCVFDGVLYEFGFGGLHGFRSAGIYHDVDSVDVSSYYPNLAIGLKLFPRHLGQAFCDTYQELYDSRKNYAKGTDENTAIKLALNGVFGQSNAEWSPFYDPQFTMGITLNGQLLLAMLCERLTISGAVKMLMSNTDGLEMFIKNRNYFERICKEWEEEFHLALESSHYKTLAARDVNNYIAILEDGKTKEKGAFETDPEIYKNRSMMIVAKAVRDYFSKNIPVEKTIDECEQISEFVIGHRAKTGNLRYRTIEGYDLIDDKMPKTVRYYISERGGSLVKVTKKEKKINSDVSPNQFSLFDNPVVETIVEDKITKLHVGTRQTLFNIWIDKPFQEYGVDKKFYINEANKLLRSVTNQQTSL